VRLRREDRPLRPRRRGQYRFRANLAGTLQQALTIARFEPGMYEVVETYVPGDAT
jgi:hypothetical protein